MVHRWKAAGVFVHAILFFFSVMFFTPLISLDLVCCYVITPLFSFVQLDIGGRMDR